MFFFGTLMYPIEKRWHCKFLAKCTCCTSYLQSTAPKKQKQLEAALARNCNRHHGTCTGQDRGVSKVKAFKSDDVGLIHTRGMAWL